MLYNRNSPAVNSLAGIPVPNSPEDVVRTFPALLSALVQMQSRIDELENKVRSLETIGGNGNQL